MAKMRRETVKKEKLTILRAILRESARVWQKSRQPPQFRFRVCFPESLAAL